MVAQRVVLMDEDGHLTLPEETRHALHLAGKAEFTLEVIDDVVVLRPVLDNLAPRGEEAWAYSPENRRHIAAAQRQFREGHARELTEHELELLVGEEKP